MIKEILPLSLAIFILSAGCLDLPGDEDEVEDMGEEKELPFDYNGILTVTYSRDFPDLSASVSMDVELKTDGSFLIGVGSPSSYAGDEVMDIEGGKVRQKETGTLDAGSGSGVVIVRGGITALAIELSVTITGEQETFAWDEDSKTWISMAKVPYTIDDPIASPVEFDLLNSTAFTGQSFIETAPQAFGSTVTHSWNLILFKA